MTLSHAPRFHRLLYHLQISLLFSCRHMYFIDLYMKAIVTKSMCYHRYMIFELKLRDVINKYIFAQND